MSCVCILVCKRKILVSIQMPSVTCLHFMSTCREEVYGRWNGLPASREATSLTIIWRLPIVHERPPILYFYITIYLFIYINSIYLLIYQVIHYILIIHIFNSRIILIIHYLGRRTIHVIFNVPPKQFWVVGLLQFSCLFWFCFVFMGGQT